MVSLIQLISWAFIPQFLFFPTAFAQFRQDYIWRTVVDLDGNEVPRPFWTPKDGEGVIQGYDLYPQAVFLEYNCYHMQEICRNAMKYLNSPRGQQQSVPYKFAYDLMSKRARKRGERACPRGWAVNNCPESDQARPMKHDGYWPLTHIEPTEDGRKIAQVANQRDSNGNVIKESESRYTCDEFPARTWIEGGVDDRPDRPVTNGIPETRCAAFRCRAKVKAEQNWQSTAHGILRRTLVDLASDSETHYPGFKPKSSFVTFNFRMRHSRNGIAARVITYTDSTKNTIQNEEVVTQARRRSFGSGARDWLRWQSEVTIDELMQYGNVTEHHVFANTTSGTSVLGSMPLPLADRSLQTYDDYEYDYEDWDDEDDNDRAWMWNSTAASAFHVRSTPNVFQPREVLKESSDPSLSPLIKRATSSELDRARKIVETALNRSAELNEARYAHPLRNRYLLSPGTVVEGGSQPGRRDLPDTTTVAPPLLEITDEIAAAAALVAEADASSGNNTKRATAATGSFWMGTISRRGTVPWGNDTNYKIFRNVLDYGAVGDGTTDDTAAIKKAMEDGKRCGKGCNGSTTKNAIVYFPPGKYLISSSIPMPFGTQVIGDATNWPTLLASKAFIGLGVLSADEYTGGGTGTDGLDQQYYVNTANFYRQIRNFRIDITQTRSSQQVAGLHYQVAQATSLQNLEFIMASGTKQRGIFAENGSGGVMSDLTFRGGAFGIYGGNQQFTSQRMTFDGCATAVQLIWDWGWVWKSINVKNVNVGFRLLQEEKSSASRKRQASNNGNIGSAAFMDSSFTNVATAVLIAPPNSKPGSGSTGIVVENSYFSGVTKAIADTAGNTILAPSSKIDYWALGPAYSSGRSWAKGKVGSYRRQSSLLDSNGNYFERAKPQYAERAVADFVHVKDFAKGDGSTDDTAAFQRALWAAQGKILFVDAGSYILTGTVEVPLNSKIVGETWSQLVASGPYFSNANDPKVMLKVGREGSVGEIEMQDLIFTTRGPTAGAILVQWNVKASYPGAAALWDCHARIGGATGTQLTPKECPALTNGVNKNCNAASLMMHLTSSASGYFENMWLWVADHMIDDPDMNDANNTMVQNSVYVARGFLIESQSATWLYGTASEHAVYYQYNFNNARTIFAGLLQTESPYYQPNPKPPAPFPYTSVKKMSGDPDYTCEANDEFSGCDESWAVIIRRSGNIMIGGAGLYSWFSTYTQSCIGSQTCQKALILLKENFSGIRFNNLITIGAKYMIVQDGKGIKATDNLNVNSHPFWSQISVYDVEAAAIDYDVGKAIWIDPKIWDMPTPSFTCSPPCIVVLPPWTSATRSIDYPVLTVSTGSWTSTITRPPLILTNIFFSPVTLTASTSGAPKLRKRQDFTPFNPTPATTPYWPAVTYEGPDGSLSTVTPTTKFPAPPSLLGTAQPSPNGGGSWPGTKRWINPYVNYTYEGPLVSSCYWHSFDCPPDLWQYGGMGPGWDTKDPYADDDPTEGDPEEEEYIECPLATSTSSSATPTSTKAPQTVTVPEPLPTKNTKHCYDDGRAVSHEMLDGAINSFCTFAGTEGELIDSSFKKVIELGQHTTPGQIGVEVIVGLTVLPNCQWKWSKDECARYLKVPIDSCDCNGVNGKKGGEVFNNCLMWRIDPNSVF